MKELFNGVTKNDLLKLKDSKAVPITAHSHEVVVPVVYATRVKEFMRKEGMRVPLKPEELQALKQKASNTEGQMEEYAKGGTIKAKKIRAKKVKINQNVVKKGNIKQVVNIKLGEKLIRRPSIRAKAIGRENIPIRPGVSSYATSTQPTYDRMIPSTGAITNQPLPVAASNLATESILARSISDNLAKPPSKPMKQGPIQGPLPQYAEEALVRQRLVDDRKRQEREAKKQAKALKQPIVAPPAGGAAAAPIELSPVKRTRPKVAPTPKP